MEKYEVFVSYRRDGGEALACLMSERLKQREYSVFYDVESLRSGKFNEKIFQVIDDCTDVIVVLPEKGLDRCKNDDDWVRKEVAYAINAKKNIIPIMMRNFEFPKDLPEDIDELRNFNAISANMEYFEASFSKLLSMLQSGNMQSCVVFELEQKEYYNIKTPFKNLYKPTHLLKETDIGEYFEKFLALVAKNVRLGSSYERIEFEKEILYSDARQWINNKQPVIETLRQKVQSLLLCNNKFFETYFYAHYIFFLMGLYKACVHDFLNYKTNIDYYDAGIIFKYVTNFDDDAFTKILNIYDEKAFNIFRYKFPLPITLLPGFLIKNNLENKNIKEKKMYLISFCIQFFDLIVDTANFMFSVVRDSNSDFVISLRTMILCNYKYLRKNKIFMPKEVQRKIFEL